MSKEILLSVVLFFCVGLVMGQHRFYGRVVEANTMEPIPYATIFLTNTTYGVAANLDGEFELEIPSGNYEVIARLLGYEPITFAINTSNLAPKGYRIELIPVEQDLELVEVEEERDPVWYRNLERFKQHFIGLSENAEKTTILNEQVLLMDSETNPAVLQVKAKDMIQIQNENLGYQIEYLLSQFTLNTKEGKILYGGNPLFISDSTGTSSQQKRWEKNRKEAYYGSIQHLMQSLYYGKSEEEGYEFRLIREIPNPERPTDEEIALAKDLLKTESDKDKRDSLITNFIMKEPLSPTVRQLINQPLPPENFISRDSLGRVFLQVEDFLQVTYTREKESKNFTGSAYVSQRGAQVSIIDQISENLEIYVNGSYSDTFGLMFEGYMAWEKVADLMPLDYLPEEVSWKEQ